MSPADTPPSHDEMLAALRANAPAFLQSHLARIGLAKREREALPDLVPQAIRTMLPARANYGLSGGFGIGKSFALAAVIRTRAEKQIQSAIAAMVSGGETWRIESAIRDGDLCLPVDVCWINWPEAVAQKRSMLFNKDWAGDVEAWIQGVLLANCMVVLDDIGAEPVTSQDWSGQLFARVIDERHRRGGLTRWTSNLDARGLVSRYGPRTFSRLQSLAPVVHLPKLPDLRLKGA